MNKIFYDKNYVKISKVMIKLINFYYLNKIIMKKSLHNSVKPTTKKPLDYRDHLFNLLETKSKEDERLIYVFIILV